MGEVVELNVATTCDIPPEKILTGAIEAKLEEVLVIGREPNGELYFASSTSDGPLTLWLLELAKQALMQVIE